MSRPSKLDAKAVKRAISGHPTLAAAAAALAVHERTLRRWLSEHPELEAARGAALRRSLGKLDKPESRKHSRKGAIRCPICHPHRCKEAP